ncbi:hypothetical protein VR611_03375 [Aquirufa nivalisilvae]|jgi:hypothetical protein|uniref:hypothetical protein n=1 Tax=Aquirufa nivalisilvae TaxID=2516557 RepID=UPI0022A930E4|nr:hypothetical protein [Aquirufa nivalisilvae]MCZ2480179.1 hypothetical protein [Aquirufa nivalisilvae]
MVKIIRFFSFLLLVCLLAGLIYYVQQKEEMEEQSTIRLEEMDLVQRYQDSLNNPPKLNEQSNSSEFYTKFEDIEAKIETETNKIVFKVSKSNQAIFQKEFLHVSCKQILSSDLNGDMQPEFWILVTKGKSSLIYAFEYQKGNLKEVQFPVLKGRQNFGYAGNDSLHVDKSYIVRSFDFKNDPYSDLPEGMRACYYSFGTDRSFVLNKTLDLEHIQQ